MKTICPKCKRKMVIGKKTKNYILIDSHYEHKKCPNPPTERELNEKEDLKALRDRISYHISVNPCEPERSFSFTYITKMIKELKDDGYSYKDQLYALDETVKMYNNKFWGYGAVKNNIYGIIAKREKVEKVRKEFEEQQKQKENKQEREISSRIIDDDMEW